MQSTRLEKLLQFLENEPQDPFLKYAIATEYVVLNEQQKALTYFEDLVLNHADYVGTYYHLGKLYEQLEQPANALKTYQQGIVVARAKNDRHALSELQAVYNSAAGLDYEDD
jgi:tetratricopeptide (TPR) repeat protein